MAQPIIVVPATDPEPAPSAEFAAGVAAATAVVATETAVEAEARSEAAQVDAGTAIDLAAAAEMTAERAHARIDDLIDRIDEAFDDLVEILNGQGGELEAAVDDGAPEPVPVEVVAPTVSDAPVGDPDKPPATVKGRKRRDGWWGDR
jgi:hypothetical protein